jgi:hypothetical protein
MEPDGVRHPDEGKLTPLHHRVDGRAADAEPSRHLAHGQEALRQQDDPGFGAPYGRPIRLVFCFVGRRTEWTARPRSPANVHGIRALPLLWHAVHKPQSRFRATHARLQGARRTWSAP